MERHVMELELMERHLRAPAKAPKLLCVAASSHCPCMPLMLFAFKISTSDARGKCGRSHLWCSESHLWQEAAGVSHSLPHACLDYQHAYI
eukprot:1161555-Pelagomonas_calceolata.AAC.11